MAYVFLGAILLTIVAIVCLHITPEGEFGVPDYIMSAVLIASLFVAISSGFGIFKVYLGW